MQSLHIRLLGHPLSADLNRLAHHNIHRPSIRHDAYIIVEHTPSMKHGRGKPKYLLHPQLQAVQTRMLLGVELFVDVVFAKCNHRHKVRASFNSQPDEALATVEHETQSAWVGFEGFARPADDDGDGTRHAAAVETAGGEQGGTGLFRDGGDAHPEEIVAVEGDAEVGVEGQEGVGDAREELREAKGFGGEGGKGAVGDDAVGMVAEDVLAGGGEGGGAVETHGEVGGEEGPEFEGAEIGGAGGEGARGVGGGEEDGEHVGNQEGPGEGNGGKEEKVGDEQEGGECVEEDDEGLETAFKGDVKWRPADSGEVSHG